MRSSYERKSDQELRLLERHPELAKMGMVPLTDTGINMIELSEFIEWCWEVDYGSEPRLRFTPGFLAWNMGASATGLAVLGKDRALLGTVLYFKKVYLKQGQRRFYVIKTGMSVHPDHRGKGIGQWLFLRLRELLSHEPIDFSIEWYDTRHDLPGSSSWILGADKNQVDDALDVRIMARILDYDTAVTYLGANGLERFLLRLNQFIFPCKKKVNLPRDYVIEGFTEERIPDYLSFLLGFQSRVRNFLIPAKDDFLRWQEGQYASTRFYALIHRPAAGRERIEGLYFGHRVKLDRRWHYFQADGIFVRPDLAKPVVKSFLRRVENSLGSSCMGITIAETGTGNSLCRYGYLPVTSQLLTMDRYALKGIHIHELKYGLVELR